MEIIVQHGTVFIGIAVIFGLYMTWGIGANDVANVEEKLALDFYYLKYRSLTMDLLILWKTLKTVVLLRGL